jgi:hypothetical protein
MHDGNGLIDHLTGVEKMQMTKVLQTISHCKYLSILLVDCVTKNKLFRKKRRRLIVMTMTINIFFKKMIFYNKIINLNKIIKISSVISQIFYKF